MWLHDLLEGKIEQQRQRMERLLQKYGDFKLGEFQLRHLLNGMRGLDLLVSDVSYVDPIDGLRIRDLSVEEVLKKLPRTQGNEMPLAGGVYFLGLIGEIPTLDEALKVEEEWRRRSDLPYHVADMLRSMPQDTHPMVMFSQAILALQSRSEFTLQYKNNLRKVDYWRPTLMDSLNLVSKTPAIAAAIYNIKYLKRDLVPPSQTSDWSSNFAYMIHKDWDEQFKELCRLFFIIHSDQGIGNVSGHTAWLVNSALSDIYFSCSAAINGLAGPLHGRANQDTLEWLLGIIHEYGSCPTEEQLEGYIWDTLNSGKIVPGYGHPVLRHTDPRFIAQLEFSQKRFEEDDILRLVKMVYKIAPKVLSEHGKTRNPWPNIDAISGSLLYHCGIKEYDFYTVLFGVGRVIGITINLVWARALFAPLERPQSITLDNLEQRIGQFAE